MKFWDINGRTNGKYESSGLVRHFRPRKLSRSIGVVFGAAISSISSLAFSLGLGEIQSTSFIGQPLEANIELVSLDGNIDVDRLLVRQVTGEEAEQMGVDLIQAHSRFEIKIDQSNKIPFISVISRQPVKEPYLNLLIELRWPNGVVYREYPILLDPPPKAPVIAAKKPQQQPLATQPRVSGPAKAEKNSGEKSVAGARRLKLEPLATQDGKYRVKSGDTLSKIAERWREGSDRGIYDTMQWIYDNNLQAFTNQNIDLLRAGAVLQMPDLSAYSVDNEVPSAEEQTKAVQVKEPTEGSVKPATAEELESKVSNSVRSVTEQSNALKRGLLTVGTVSQDDSTRELIDMLVRENESLRSRMEKIENSEYLETLKQLIILQRQQISELRSKVGVSDVDNNQEVDALLERIGIDGEQAPASQLEAVVRSEDLEGKDQAENAQVELASENVIAKKDTDEELAPVQVDPVLSAPVMANQTEKSWLIWLVIGGGAAIIAAFAGLLIYYRKLTAKDDAKYLQDKPDDQEDDFFAELDDGSASDVKHAVKNEPSLHHSPYSHAVVAEHEEEPNISYTGSGSAEYAPKHPQNETWLGETADITEEDIMDMDAAMKEVQEAFDDLLLDESVLDELEKESTLEAITQEMPSRDSKEKKDKGPRRTDDELRMSIAEKMAQYNPEEYRQEIEKLGLLELDEISDDDHPQDEVETAIYRAMMFCEFKKFDKARELIRSQQELGADDRLVAAMEQIEEMAEAAKEGSKQAG